MEELKTRAQRTAETRTLIVETGRKLFRKYGYNKVQVEMIVKTAGISVGTFYYHFKSKNELFVQVCKEVNSYFCLPSNLDYEKDNCIERIVEYFMKYSDFIMSIPMEKLNASFWAESGNHTFLDKNRAMYQVLNVMLDGFQKAGKLVDISVLEITNNLFICARGCVYDWLLNEGSYNLGEKIRNIISRMAISYTIKSEISNL